MTITETILRELMPTAEVICDDPKSAKTYLIRDGRKMVVEVIEVGESREDEA